MNERRLLILDDDPMIGRTIQTIANAAGVETRFTEDPAEFFRAIEDWGPSHIAIDLVMPQMDGVEVVIELARRGCNARIIISSGVDPRILDAAGRSAAEHGLDIAGVLSKPFSPGELRALLDCEITPYPQKGKRSASPPAFQVTSDALQEALAARQLCVYYQPKIICATGELAGFETLVRWHHPEQGLIMPDCFIPVAERHGLIDALTSQVFDLALTWFSQHFPEARRRLRPGQPEPGIPDTTLAINFSARTLGDQGFVDRLATRCTDHNVAPSRIVFELTESSAMEDPRASLGLLTRLRMKDFQLSIDDFGTGFSSMLQLVRLPFSEIKIDKSFVMSARQSGESRSVIRSIVDLAHSLGLQTTAEGVEDADTLEFLTRIGCTQAQGYHIARPMPGDDVLHWISGREAPETGLA